jgi:hypothetical protein
MARMLGAALTAALVAGGSSGQTIVQLVYHRVCSSDRTAAEDFVSDSDWGAVIDTNDLGGREDLFCVVKGPNAKKRALRERDVARDDGVSESTYIKRACFKNGGLH